VEIKITKIKQEGGDREKKTKKKKPPVATRRNARLTSQ
jgi:hypothetical protein